MNKVFLIPLVFGLCAGVYGCHQTAQNGDVQNAGTSDSASVFSEVATDELGPCGEAGVALVEAQTSDQGLGYRKCWSSKIKKFASEIYKDGKNVLTYMIPTQSPDDKHERFSPAIELLIKRKIIESGMDEFEDKENIGQVRFVDLNFDGHLDALIYKGIYESPVWTGKNGMPEDEDTDLDPGDKKLEPQKYYDGYLWSVEKNRFVYENELHSIASPVIDDQAQVIRMMRKVQYLSRGYKGTDNAESEYDPEDFLYESSYKILRYRRDFVELKYQSGHYVYNSAVTFVSCGDYTEEWGNSSIVGSQSGNRQCVDSEYDYPDDGEYRTKAYVPVDELSLRWAVYIRGLGNRNH